MAFWRREARAARSRIWIRAPTSLPEILPSSQAPVRQTAPTENDLISPSLLLSAGFLTHCQPLPSLHSRRLPHRAPPPLFRRRLPHRAPPFLFRRRRRLLHRAPPSLSRRRLSHRVAFSLIRRRFLHRAPPSLSRRRRITLRLKKEYWLNG